MELVLNGEVVARGNITAQTTVHGERVESHESAVMLVKTCTRAPPGYSQNAFCAGSFTKWPTEDIKSPSMNACNMYILDVNG